MFFLNIYTRLKGKKVYKRLKRFCNSSFKLWLQFLANMETNLYFLRKNWIFYYSVFRRVLQDRWYLYFFKYSTFNHIVFKETNNAVLSIRH